MAINRAFFSVLHMLYYRVIHEMLLCVISSLEYQIDFASNATQWGLSRWSVVQSVVKVCKRSTKPLGDGITKGLTIWYMHIRSTCEWYKRRHWSTVYVEYGHILTSSSIYPLSSDSPLGFGNEKSFELGVAALVFHLLTYSDSTGYSMLQTQLGETMISPHYHHTAGPPHNSCVHVCFS